MRRLIEAEEKQLAELEHHFALIDRNAAVMEEESRIERLTQEVRVATRQQSFVVSCSFAAASAPPLSCCLQAEGRGGVQCPIRHKSTDDPAVLAPTGAKMGSRRRSEQE